MTVSSARPAPRTQADRCPGLLRPHRAADGALVRLRLPGGRIGGAALHAVSVAAARFGDGQVQLTSRGNLQLRGVSVDDDGQAPPALVEAIAAAGLLPSATHELVRNITCSPLTGRSGGRADLRRLVTDLDDMLCSTPALAALPGPFRFALDDGRGDVLDSALDLGLHAVGADHAALIIGGRMGPVVALRDALPLLRTLALGFLDVRGSGPDAVWHVGELPDAGAGLVDRLPNDVVRGRPAPRPRPSASTVSGPALRPSPGLLRQGDGLGLLAVDVPLGLLTGAQVGAVTSIATGAGSGEVIITPWRSLLIPDLVTRTVTRTSDRTADRTPDGDAAGFTAELAAAGLVTDLDSGWHGVSACTGAPGCASAGGPTPPVAAALAGPTGAGSARPVHVVACERRCGSPAVDHVEVLVLAGARRRVTRRQPPDGARSSAQPPPEPLEPTTVPDLIDIVALTRNVP